MEFDQIRIVDVELADPLISKPLPADEVCTLFQQTHEHHWAPETA